MKHLRHLALCLLLVLSMATNAFAAEVPESFTTENLNGQQRLVKTYTLSPDIDPETLKEPSFEYDGFIYSWAYTTKEEHAFLSAKDVVEVVTVETSRNDLAQILAELAPDIEYDDGEYTGVLTLDHTTLSTDAAGYATRYRKTTETKVIGNLDRNDMSYVPATTVKNGKTLSLDNVDWQVTATALVGEALVPSQYQAIATYSASNSYKAATGYVTTAEYRGEVTSEGIKSITYTVVFTGEEVMPTTPDSFTLTPSSVMFALIFLTFLLLIGLAVFLFLHRKNVYVYIPGDEPRNYKLVAKYRVDPKNPCIDISDITPSPERTVAVEVKRSLAKKLIGQEFSIQYKEQTYSYQITQAVPGDWHEFNVDLLQEVPT